MTELTEGRHAGECILNEAQGHYCREVVTILAGEGKLQPNAVIGKVATDTGTVTVGTPSTLSGKGTLTKASTAYSAAVQEGTYRIQCIEEATDGGAFEVIRPDGTVDGVAVVGAAYDGQVKFTIADGATDFAVGDAFTLAVSIADLSGAGSYRSADPTNTDGSGIAKGVLIYGADATSVDAKAVALVRGPAEVKGNALVYDAAVDDAGKEATKIAELKAVGIIVR